MALIIHVRSEVFCNRQPPIYPQYCASTIGGPCFASELARSCWSPRGASGAGRELLLGSSPLTTLKTVIYPVRLPRSFPFQVCTQAIIPRIRSLRITAGNYVNVVDLAEVFLMGPFQNRGQLYCR